MIYTRLHEGLPSGVGGFVVRDGNDDYTIILNANDSREANMVTYLHEREHIENGDLDRDDPADEIETDRHRA